MKVIKEITDKEATGEDLKFPKEFKFRKAARAVVFNGEGKIALMVVAKYCYHKLPGGGIEEGEDIPNALGRELKEEIGYDIKINYAIGMTVEYKGKYAQKQESFCYIGEVVEGDGKISLTDEEKEAGFSLVWMTIDKAISVMKKDSPKDYTARFIRARDLAILNEAKKIIGRKRK